MLPFIKREMIIGSMNSLNSFSLVKIQYKSKFKDIENLCNILIILCLNYSLSFIFVLLPLPSRYRLEDNVPHRSSTFLIVPQLYPSFLKVTYRYLRDIHVFLFLSLFCMKNNILLDF
jgi:hypothetical protein